MFAEGIVDRVAKFGNRTPLRLHFNQHGSLRVAQLGASDQEMARWGRGFFGGTQIIANGIAPVAAIPTTTATLALINSDLSGTGRSLVIDHIYYGLGSGTAAAGSSLFLTVAKPTAALPTAQPTGYGIQSASGSKNTSVAYWGTAIALQVGSNWFAANGSFQLAAANVGQGDQPQFFNGRLIVPPGWCLGIAILSGAGTTPLYFVSSAWDEPELDLE